MSAEGKPPRVVHHNPEWVAREVERLEAELAVWDRLIDTHRTREDLADEIDNYKWMLGETL